MIDDPSPPLVTIVVPAFNEPAAILEESLTSLMVQTFENFECIIVDDSTDPACAAACASICARDPRFLHVRPGTRLGLAASLNHGIGLARGQLIARFDSDDICIPERLALQVAFMDANPSIGILGGGLEIIDDKGASLAFRDYPAEDAAIQRQFHTTTAIAHPTVMIRKALLVECRGYKPEFRYAEDLDLWLRMANRGVRFANLETTLVRYRQQTTQRASDHWRFNLRARLRNFHTRHLLRRVLGIVAIGAWIYTPSAAQQMIFKHMLFRRKLRRTDPSEI